MPALRSLLIINREDLTPLSIRADAPKFVVGTARCAVRAAYGGATLGNFMEETHDLMHLLLELELGIGREQPAPASAGLGADILRRDER